MRANPPQQSVVAPPSPRLLTWFTRHCTRDVGKHFHAMRIMSDANPVDPDPDHTLVLYCNHASWWDALVGLLLKDLYFGKRIGYAPIDAEALEKYRFFRKLGFFGVDRSSPRHAAADFIRNSKAVLDRPNSLLFLTPQGKFTDIRDTSVGFDGGIDYLARKPSTVFIPIAIEYTFWEEKRPEVLIRMGPPAPPDALLPALLDAQKTLANASIRRDAAAFTTILGGASGTNPVYDLWRKLLHKAKGEDFDPSHGTL